MRVHYLQHVPFEGIGSMAPYFEQKGHELTATHLYLDQALPGVEAVDWVIVMGGPMGVRDELQYPWMNAEKAFIKSAVDAGKIVLGICLGAQLIADVLGAKVYKNSVREIGWFPVNVQKGDRDTILDNIIPDGIDVFHWHGDTFDIPNNGTLLASSKACKNQGFVIENRIVGFQFHLETTLESAAAPIENCKNELDGSTFVQSAEELMADENRFIKINQVMKTVLEKLETNCS